MTKLVMRQLGEMNTFILGLAGAFTPELVVRVLEHRIRNEEWISNHAFLEDLETLRSKTYMVYLNDCDALSHDFLNVASDFHVAFNATKEKVLNDGATPAHP